MSGRAAASRKAWRRRKARPQLSPAEAREFAKAEKRLAGALDGLGSQADRPQPIAVILKRIRERALRQAQGEPDRENARG